MGEACVETGQGEGRGGGRGGGRAEAWGGGRAEGQHFPGSLPLPAPSLAALCGTWAFI